MSTDLATRLAARKADALPSGKGCQTCKWLASRSEEDRADITAWLDAGLSATPLWEECVADGLPVKLSSFRGHLRHCQ